jgi:hypothetical protein
VLAGRLLHGQEWQNTEANARGEILWTGRATEYAASTVRKSARTLATGGATAMMNVQVREQVHAACKGTQGPVRAYTDMFDQVYWSKKPAHAGPVGRLGNRRLCATYVGMTFVQAGTGPTLGYALSWHKPAAPLQDALSALYDQDPERSAWLLARATTHIWDRGGSGEPTTSRFNDSLSWPSKNSNSASKVERYASGSNLCDHREFPVQMNNRLLRRYPAER